MKIAVVVANGKAARKIISEADGIRTGEYILAGEEFTVKSKGESVISYADYAIAVVDEAVKGNHIQQRISVVAE